MKVLAPEKEMANTTAAEYECIARFLAKDITSGLLVTQEESLDSSELLSELTWSVLFCRLP